MVGENVAQERKQFQLWLNQMLTWKDLSWVIGELKCLHFILFYFIILPHTMNYKHNKNDNK